MSEIDERENDAPNGSVGCLLFFVGFGATAIISGFLSQVICRNLWGLDHPSGEDRTSDMFPFLHACVWFLAVVLTYPVALFSMKCASDSRWPGDPQRELAWSVVIASLIVTTVLVAHAAHYHWEPLFAE